jgi:hypothetical protein
VDAEMFQLVHRKTDIRLTQQPTTTGLEGGRVGYVVIVVAGRGVGQLTANGKNIWRAAVSEAAGQSDAVQLAWWLAHSLPDLPYTDGKGKGIARGHT